MKMSQIVSVLIAAVVIVTSAGCSSIPSFGKKGSSSTKNQPPAPPPVSVAGSSTASAASPASNQTQPMLLMAARPVRPALTDISMFDQMIDNDLGQGSGRSLLITNHRKESIVVLISDRLVGRFNRQTGRQEIIVIPPGEPFAFKDPGLAKKTLVKVVVLSDADKPLGFLGMWAEWPRRGGDDVSELHWHVYGEIPAVGGQPAIPDMMIPLPTSAGQSGGLKPFSLPKP